MVIYLINQCKQLAEIIFPKPDTVQNLLVNGICKPSVLSRSFLYLADFSVRTYYNFLSGVKDIYYTASSYVFQCVLRYGLTHIPDITAKSIIYVLSLHLILS